MEYIPLANITNTYPNIIKYKSSGVTTTTVDDDNVYQDNASLGVPPLFESLEITQNVAPSV